MKLFTFCMILYFLFLQSSADKDADLIEMQQQIAELQEEVKSLKQAKPVLHGKYI